MIRLQTGISVFNVIFAAASELAIAILRKNCYFQSTGNSDFTLKSLLPVDFQQPLRKYNSDPVFYRIHFQLTNSFI